MRIACALLPLLAACASRARPEGSQILRQIELLAHPDIEVRDEAESQLRSWGPATLPFVRQAMQSSDTDIAGRCRGIVYDLADARTRYDMDGGSGIDLQFAAILARPFSSDRQWVALRDSLSGHHAACIADALEGHGLCQSHAMQLPEFEARESLRSLALAAVWFASALDAPVFEALRLALLAANLDVVLLIPDEKSPLQRASLLVERRDAVFRHWAPPGGNWP